MSNYDYLRPTIKRSRQLEYKERIRARFNNTCQLCGKPGRDVDHIIPWHISHDSSEANLRVLCHSCNCLTRRARKDGNLPLDQWWAWVEAEAAKDQ